MELQPFKLERLMSTWQNEVEVDLSSSGVDAARLADVLSLDEFRAVYESTPLKFIQTNGPVPLREAIAAHHEDCSADNILVANGSSEALMVLLWHLCEPGTKVVEISPTYSLVGGLAKTFGAKVEQARLLADDEWRLDAESLDRVVTPDTDIVYVCNPNNPTGSILTPAEREAIVAAASRAGAWLIADEIYHGAELDGTRTRSFWGSYERTIVTSSLSKAHGLAGLRLGWLIAPSSLTRTVWPYHDYTTTTTTAISAELALLAIEPARERALLDRALAISRRNVAVLGQWMDDNSDLFAGPRTKIGGLSFIQVTADTGLGSEALTTHLVSAQGLLVGPGDYFGQDGYLRVGYSVPHLAEGLDRLAAGVRDLATQTST